MMRTAAETASLEKDRKCVDMFVCWREERVSTDVCAPKKFSKHGNNRKLHL